MMYYYYLQVCNGIFLEGKHSLEDGKNWAEQKISELQTLRGKKSNIVVYTIYLENHDDDGVLEEVKQTIL